LGRAKTRIFLQMGLDRQFTDLPVGHIRTAPPGLLATLMVRRRSRRLRPTKRL
jgi:hypothetical protein